MLLLIDAALLALATILSFLLRRAGREERRRAEAEATAELTEAGLRAEGKVLGGYVARPIDGADVVLTNRTSPTRPGAVESIGSACVVTVAAPLPDQLVCKASEADLVMGPLPAAPRLRTGYAPFDEAHAVFVGAADREVSASYRDAPESSAIPWARPPLLDALLDLELLWMRVREGRAELVFPPLEPVDVGRAAALAIAVGQTAQGKPAPALARGPRATRAPLRDAAFAVTVAWVAGLLVGIAPVGILLCFLSPLRVLDAELVCGPGDRIVTVSAGEGATLECDGHPDRFLALHWLGGGLLGLSLVVLVGLGIVLVRRMRARAVV
jgi:hypothetical protein